MGTTCSRVTEMLPFLMFKLLFKRNKFSIFSGPGNIIYTAINLENDFEKAKGNVNYISTLFRIVSDKCENTK